MGKILFLILGLALGLLLARYLRGQRAGRDLSAPPRPMVRVGDERIDNDEIRALIRADRKIEAIKLVRERTGLSLAEAKDAVQAVEQTMR
jgi:large subunit ribosomal protein L7/L12